jgi:hypothetical protein
MSESVHFQLSAPSSLNKNVLICGLEFNSCHKNDSQNHWFYYKLYLEIQKLIA